MTIVHGHVRVTDSQGNETVAPFEFSVAEPVSEESTDGVREISGSVADGFTVPAGEVWEVKGLVETPKNVVVEGTLRMRPGSTLRFVNVNESAFVGGGMDPLASDVGLWVMGEGVLDAQGTPKAAWNRTGWDPSWHQGDEVLLAPWSLGDSGGFAPYHGGSVPRAHPSVPATEVLNLARDVVIEGAPGGRSHVFVRSMKPQTIRHVLVRHVGPRKGGMKVAGRWGLHFHHMHEHARGSVVEGVVVRDSGSHAFVAHLSHGITFRDCIAYNVQEDAYWWDPRTHDLPKTSPPDNFTNDTTYERCVAALVLPGDDPGGQRLCGFNLGQGTVALSNRAVGCLAVGVLGGKSSSGFAWVEDTQGEPWSMVDNVSHNNVAHGLFTWQNLSMDRLHVFERFTAYRNGNAGMALGAYEGNWVSRDALLVENQSSGILQHARSLDDTRRGRHERPTVIGSPVAFREGDVNFPDQPPVIVCGETVIDVPVLVDDSASQTPTFEFVAC